MLHHPSSIVIITSGQKRSSSSSLTIITINNQQQQLNNTATVRCRVCSSPGQGKAPLQTNRHAACRRTTAIPMSSTWGGAGRACWEGKIEVKELEEAYRSWWTDEKRTHMAIIIARAHSCSHCSCVDSSCCTAAPPPPPSTSSTMRDDMHDTKPPKKKQRKSPSPLQQKQQRQRTIKDKGERKGCSSCGPLQGQEPRF